MSVILFHLALESVMKRMNVTITNGIINAKTVRIVAYADDIVVISSTKKDLKQICGKLIETSDSLCLELSE